MAKSHSELATISALVPTLSVIGLFNFIHIAKQLKDNILLAQPAEEPDSYMPFPWWREGKGYLKMHICHWYTGQVLEIMLTAGCCDLQEVLKLKVGGWLCKGSQTARQTDRQTDFPRYRLSDLDMLCRAAALTAQVMLIVHSGALLLLPLTTEC